MIEEIPGARFEIVEIERPAAHRNRKPELVLFVPLSVQRNEADVLALRKFEQRTGDGCQRRRLIKAAVVAAQNPVKTRDSERSANPRVRRVLGDVR